ncbi:MAG: MFS transporter [Candidatus Acidiferrum sp.]|jgi:ACS family tartrate transporter-like MFS transporter
MAWSPALAIEHSARRRIAIRILPFLWFLYVVAFLDRVNVAYAALEMSHDLRFSDRVFGLGAGIFFVGYVLLEIPGALIVERWSARLWITRIMITWGIITVFVGFVHTAHQFYLVRFLLGAAEAGFFPGVIVYLTHWFTRRDLAKAVASFMAAIPLANLLGSPLAGRVLRVHWYGLQGWRWLFILEGIPAVVFGLVTYFYLTDRPSQAAWLPEKEREWITCELEEERQHKVAVRSYTIGQALRQRNVILLTLVYFTGNTGFYGFTMWFPTILKRASGLATGTVTLLVTIPYLVALTATLLNSWHSDRTQERRWHVAGPLFIGAVGLWLAIASGSHFWTQLAFFSIFAACVHAFQPCFWALPTLMLGESAAAASIGLINALGNLGGFVGPSIMGYMVGFTGSFTSGLIWLLANLVAGGILVLLLRGIRLQKT